MSSPSEASVKKDTQKLQRAIVDGLEDVKAQDIQVFNTEHLSPLFERVIDEGIASGTFEPRDRDRAIAFVIDATHRFIHPAALELESDVPQASVDIRLSTLIRVSLRVLIAGIV